MPDRENPDDVQNLMNENLRLKAAVEELSILNDIATAIGSTLSLEEIIELIVKKCIKHLKVEQGSVTMVEKQEEASPFRTMIREADTSREVMPYRLDTQLTGWMLKNQKPLLINSFEDTDALKGVKREDFPFRSLLSVPLLLKGQIIGSLNVFNKRTEEGFTQDDKRLLTIIATQSAQVVENARLYKEEQALQLIQEEMRVAYKIQMDLLPKEFPAIAGYDIAGISIPAKTVGGDYFDFISIDEERLAFCLGDVSGKGMPAALLMANLQATLRGQRLDQLTPKECIKRSNALMFKSTDVDKFATFFYGILDTGKQQLFYTNAGHNYPLLLRMDKEPMRLDVGGLVLGALEEFSFSEDCVPFEPGDILIVFSDGISEAVNSSGEEFGEEILHEISTKNRNTSAEQLIDKIIDSVHHHTGGLPQRDDMTLIVIKRNE